MGLFKGVEAPIIATTPLNASVFTAHSAITKLVAHVDMPRWKLNIFTGALSGL